MFITVSSGSSQISIFPYAQKRARQLARNVMYVSSNLYPPQFQLPNNPSQHVTSRRSTDTLFYTFVSKL